MRPRSLLPATSIVLVAVSLAVPAAARTMQQKMQAACGADLAKLCPQASDGDGIKACLLAKRTAVSPDCMRFVDASE